MGENQHRPRKQHVNKRIRSTPKSSIEGVAPAHK